MSERNREASFKEFINDLRSFDQAPEDDVVTMHTSSVSSRDWHDIQEILRG